MKVTGTAGLVSIAMLVTVFAAHAEEVPEVLRAQRFELVNATGQVIGMLTGTEEGPALVLMDAEGKKRATVAVKADGPSVTLLAADETPKATLNLGNDGHPGLNLKDATGKTRYDLRLREDERPCMLFWDQKAEKPRMGVGVNPMGNPNMNLFDAEFVKRAWIHLLADEGPGLGVASKEKTVWSTPEAK